VVFVPLSDDNPLRSIPFQWVTIALIALNCIAFALQLSPGGDSAIASFGLTPAELFGSIRGIGGGLGGASSELQVPEGLTLITYQFLHGDILHLLSNMIFLWVFGDNVEDAMGHVKFIIFYLLCGIVAGLAHAYFAPTSTMPLIGASGAVAGVISAYLLLHPRVRVWCLAFRFIPLRIPAAWVLGVWAATQVVMVLIAPPGDQVAWWAHIGGLVAGAVLILFMRRPGVPLFDRGLPQVPAS
jgi:membrane associated rhomboid family serine protease